MEGLPRRPGAVARPGPLPDQLTRDDLRGLRRWVLVAGVWALAATAIALIALLDSSDRSAEKGANAAADRAVSTERKLDLRIDALDRRLDELPRAEDVSKLGGRLSGAETDASKAAEDAKGAREKVSDLEDRVKQLEEDATTPPDSGGLEQP